MITSDSITDALSSLGLHPNDTVLIHADAGIAAQLKGDSGAEKITKFIDSLKSYFNSGTILSPAFSYSATKAEIFNPSSTKSDVGLFSELFRLSDEAVRTSHPIFSFSVWGKNKNSFIETNNRTCFGKASLFEKFYNVDGKLLCLGCSFDRVTFTHYVEEKLRVYYRYPKEFEAIVQVGENVETYNTTYFVRDLDLDSEIDLRSLREALANEHFLKLSSLGRFPVLSVSAKHFEAVAVRLYNRDKNALIRQGKTNA
jgi:aminoglycoside 3-N-acetyltransferase